MNSTSTVQQNRRLLAAAGIVIGIVLLVIAIVYFALPASGLPHFFPGYNPALATHHIKHGIASLLLGLAAFALAWFSSGPASAQNK